MPLFNEWLNFGGVEIQAKIGEILKCQLTLDKVHLLDAKSTMATLN